MKYVFNDLGSIKKEATKLHKLAKSKGLPSKLSNAQNAIANHYGWQHYNEMSMVHERIGQSNMYGSIDSDGTFIYESGRRQVSGLALVTSLSDIQKRILDSRLHTIVRNYFMNLGAQKSSADEWVDEFKYSKGLIKKFFEPSQHNVTSLLSLPSKALSRGTMIKSKSSYDRSDIYASLALPDATMHGGMFMLESHMVEKILPEAIAMSDGRSISILKTDFYNHQAHSASEQVEVFEALPLAFDGSCSCLVSQAISIELEEDSVNDVGDFLIGDEVSLQERVLLNHFLSQVGSELQSGTFSELNFIKDTLEMIWAIEYKGNYKKLEEWSEDPALSNKQSPLCIKFAAYMHRYGFCNVSSDSQDSEASFHAYKERFLDSGLIVGMLITLKTLGLYVDAINPWYTSKSHEKMGLFSRLRQGHIVVIPMDSDNPKSLFLSKMIFRQYRSAHICLLGAPLENVSIQGEVVQRKVVLGGSVFVTDNARVLSKGGSIVIAQLRATGLRSIVNVTEYGMDEGEYDSLRANVSVIIFAEINQFWAYGRECNHIGWLDVFNGMCDIDLSLLQDSKALPNVDNSLFISFVASIGKNHKSHWQVARIEIENRK